MHTVNPIVQLLPAIILVVAIIIIYKLSNAKKNTSNTEKQIKETRCTCQACGKVWYYGKQEFRKNKADHMANSSAEISNCGTDLMCCGGCLPAAIIPRDHGKQIKDLNKCPDCNSSAIKKEEVIHNVE